MQSQAYELRQAVRQWADGALQSEGEHPSLAALDAYAGGETADAERLRDHLAVCPQCAALVLELAAFPDVAPAAGVAPLSAEELAAEWERLAPKAPAGPRAAGPRRARGRGWAAGGRLPWTLAASFAGLSLMTGVWGWRQFAAQRALREPQVNNVAVDLLPADAQTRGDDQQATPVSFSGRWFPLRLNVGKRLDAGPFELEIAKAGGDVVKRLDGLQQEEDGVFALSLPPSYLPPGTYELRLRREGDPERLTIERFELTILRE